SPMRTRLSAMMLSYPVSACAAAVALRSESAQAAASVATMLRMMQGQKSVSRPIALTQHVAKEKDRSGDDDARGDPPRGGEGGLRRRLDDDGQIVCDRARAFGERSRIGGAARRRRGDHDGARHRQ